MPKYRVVVKEVWNQPIIIEANSPSDAVSLVAECQGQELKDEHAYSYTLEPDSWEVERAE
jgi:hypothetical protein